MAIEPIKGFYVHDEVTDTDGVAKIDYDDGLYGAPNVYGLQDAIYGDGKSIELTKLDNWLIYKANNLLQPADGYATFYFEAEPGATYTITASENEVLRAGFGHFSDPTKWSYVYECETSDDARRYEFTNSNGYAYGFIFGATPNFPSPIFEVEQRIGGLEKDVSQKSYVSAGNYEELVDNGAYYFPSDDSTSYQLDCRLSTINGEFVAVSNRHSAYKLYVSLQDFSFNRVAYGGDYIAEYTGVTVVNEGEVLAVNVDLNISSNTFEQFAIGIKKPASSVTEKVFFNISNSDIDENGNFKYSNILKMPAGTNLGTIFLYFQDANAHSGDRLVIKGRLSVAKYAETINNITIGDTIYNLVGATEDNVNPSRGYAKANGKLYKRGKYIVNSDNVPVELRGYGLHAILQYSNLHGWNALRSLREHGCNMIRVSVYLEDYIFDDSDGEIAYGYLSHPYETKAEIERIIKNCVGLGLYVLLDWHVFSYQAGIVNHAPYTGTDVLHQTEAEEFFTYFTQKYGDCPNMLWEIANEPHNLTPAQLAPFVRDIRDIITNNVADPVMVCGYCSYGDTEVECRKLYDELANNYNITDVFISPHAYPPGTAFLNAMKSMYNSDFPVFSTEWGNSSSSGSGGSSDTETKDFLDWMHTVGLPQAVWKFTDQTYLCSVLTNQGVINSEKWLNGFDTADISQNGRVVLDKWAEYVRDGWIDREPIA